MVVNNKIAPYYAGQPVVIIGYDDVAIRDSTSPYYAPARRNRFKAADPTAPVTLPHLMVDSGHQSARGGTRDQTYYYNTIRSMIDKELARAPKAVVTATYKRVLNHVVFTVKVTNQSGVALYTVNNGAMVHGVVYESFTNTTRPAYTLVNNFARVAAYTTITTSLANGATATYTLTTRDLPSGTKWANLHYVAMVDYRPAGSTGAYDMLQAAFATPAP